LGNRGSASAGATRVEKDIGRKFIGSEFSRVRRVVQVGRLAFGR